MVFVIVYQQQQALCPGLPRRAGTRRNIHSPPSCSSSNLYQLLPSTAIHSILPVQIVCLAIFFHNLYTSFLVYLLVWRALPYISLPFTFRNTCPYHHNLFCCSISIISSIPSLFLNSLLGTLSFTLTLHIHLTILISAH